MEVHYFNTKIIKTYTNLPLLVLQGKPLHLETIIFHSSHLLTIDNWIYLTLRKNFKVSLCFSCWTMQCSRKPLIESPELEKEQQSWMTWTSWFQNLLHIYSNQDKMGGTDTYRHIEQWNEIEICELTYMVNWFLTRLLRHSIT